MFIGAEQILGILDSYRLIWISGRPGGHKTALAFMIAKRFLESGYRLVTNSRSVWADDLKDVDLDHNNHLHSVVLLDEGGLYFKASRQIEEIASYVAKMDQIFIIPSFWAPAKIAQAINIQPVVSLKATGLPIIVYKWRVDVGATKDKGIFFWWDPKEIYGVYSRQDPGEDPEEIIKFLISKKDQYRKRYGRKTSDEVFKLETVSEAEQFMEAAQIMEATTSDFATLSHRSHKKR